MDTSYFSDLWEDIKFLSQPDQFCKVCDSVAKNPLTLWLIGVIIAYFIYRIYRRNHDKILRVHSTKRGLVYLKRSALKNLIKKVCRSIVAQSDARVKICTCCRKLHIKVAISSPHDVQPTGIQLQQTIYQVLQQEVGLTNIGRIDVIVNHIYGPVRTNFNDSKEATCGLPSDIKGENFAHCNCSSSDAVSEKNCDECSE